MIGYIALTLYLCIASFFGGVVSFVSLDEHGEFGIKNAAISFIMAIIWPYYMVEFAVKYYFWRKV